MNLFVPPTQDQALAIDVNAGIDELARHERFATASPDMVAAIVEGIAQFACGEWAPLNSVGDREGAIAENGIVSLPEGFAKAYQAYVEQGWNSIYGATAFGGQDLPFTLACCVLESLGGANLAFSLLPMLTVGAIEAIEHHGSDAQKTMYLPKLISGEWSGRYCQRDGRAGWQLLAGVDEQG